MPTTIITTAETMMWKSTNHQYSERRARPENPAWLVRTAFTASMKDIWL